MHEDPALGGDLAQLQLFRFGEPVRHHDRRANAGPVEPPDHIRHTGRRNRYHREVSSGGEIVDRPYGRISLYLGSLGVDRRDLTVEACFPKVRQYHIAIVATSRRGADDGDRARPDQRIHDIWHCRRQQGISRARPARCTSISPGGKSAARCGRAICRSPHPSAAGQRTPRPALPWTGRTPPTKVRP